MDSYFLFILFFIFHQYGTLVISISFLIVCYNCRYSRESGWMQLTTLSSQSFPLGTVASYDLFYS